MRSHMIHGAERRARSCEPTGSSTSPSYHTATKTQFSPDLSLSNSMTACVRRTELQKIVFLLPPFTLIAIACRMEPREHQSKCQRGWVKLSLQFWGERPNWLKKPRRVCSMKRTGIPFSAGQLKRWFIKPNTNDFSNNTKMTISITSLTWLCSLCCWDISLDIFDHAKMRQWFRGQVFFTLVNSSIFRDHELKWITVVCQYFMVRKINHTQYF